MHVTHSDGPWVIDSGASFHLIGMSSLFSSYNPCSGREKVKIIDGSLSSCLVKAQFLSRPLCLSSILHVPDFSTNLLSIMCITCELDCQVFFILILVYF
jgi:hypothetical protein